MADLPADREPLPAPPGWEWPALLALGLLALVFWLSLERRSGR